MFSGSQSRRGKSQSPVTRVAGCRETETRQRGGRLLVDRVKRPHGLGHARFTEALAQDDRVEIIPHGVPRLSSPLRTQS